jgi:hypothetical protein
MNNYKRRLHKIYDKVNKIATIGRDNEIEYYKYIDEVINKGDWSVFEEMLNIYYNIRIINNPSVDVVKKNTWVDICLQTKSNFLQRLTKYYKIKEIYQQGTDIFSDNITPNISISDKLDADMNAIGEGNVTIVADNYIKITFNDPNVFYIFIYDNSMRELFIGNITENQTINTNIPTNKNTEYLIKVLMEDSSIYYHKLTISYNPYLGKIIEKDIWNKDVKYYIQNGEYARVIGERTTQLEVFKNNNESIVIDWDLNLPPIENQFNQYKKAIDFLLS